MPKSKSSGSSRLAKKSAGKRQSARTAAKSAVKRGTKRGAGKAPPKQAAPAPVKDAPVSLSSAALAAEPERKPVKKAEPRSNRPPAVLPIPQSTFFF